MPYIEDSRKLVKLMTLVNGCNTQISAKLQENNVTNFSDTVKEAMRLEVIYKRTPVIPEVPHVTECTSDNSKINFVQKDVLGITKLKVVAT